MKEPLFLDFLYNHRYRYIDQNNGRPPIISNVAREDLNKDGYEAYMTVNGFPEDTQHTKENCINLNTFFIDIDGRKDLEELEQIKKKLEPSFIIETMNGFHLYWLLDEPLYKEEIANWDEVVAEWEKIEENLVNSLNADKAVKDVTRILRQPNTYYWKKTGDKYKEGTKGIFKITGIHKNLSATYTFDQVKEAFPIIEKSLELPTKKNNRSEIEQKNFFEKVNAIYPIEQRDSFKRLTNALPDSLPQENTRNQALIITASLMKQAGWDVDRAYEQIKKVGWHGMEKERGGVQEIMNTINSAYKNNYTYSKRNEIIAHNMTDTEQMLLEDAYSIILKGRRELDKIRFSTYEREILSRHPHLKKNDIGMILDYKGGVYKIMLDQEVSDMILTCLEEDMLLTYRTGRNVSDKISCLLSIIPKFEVSKDRGFIANVKNGLLNIYTRELKPHTPDYMSLIQYNVTYDQNATCPLWEQCIHEWMEGDEEVEKALLLQQFAGYLLSTSAHLDKALFLVGDGGNGKSTFVDTIAMVIGPQATSHIDLESLYGQFGMAGLIGKKLNIIEEVHGNYYQSNKLKKLISGEPVSIDIKYKDQFLFKPEVKFIFSVNMMPRVDDVSSATERRMCLVTFGNNFRDKPNTKLRTHYGDLAKELSGIFNWMLEGAKSLADMGNFIETDEKKEMMSEYRIENSSVEGYIHEQLRMGEGFETDSKEMYEDYQEWCKTDGRKFKSNVAFTKEMKAHGTKNNLFTFQERTSGKANSRFVGVGFLKKWTDF